MLMSQPTISDSMPDFVYDFSAPNFDTIFISASRRGLQIEISPEDLALTQTLFLDISR